MRTLTYPLAISLCLLSALAHAQLFGPIPYLKPADAPPGFSDGTLNLEDFEDQRIASDIAIRGNIPTTLVAPSTVTDSVDYDDRALDGLGRSGHTLQSAGFIRIDFKTRPQSAGVVWTDGGGAVTFEAFATDGSSLGTSGPHALADGNASGGTAEDRFFGVRNVNGIKAIEIRANGGIEIDHVQWSVNFAASSNNVAAFALPNPGFVRVGTVVELERFSDGSFLTAGEISALDGVSRTGLAKLTPLGSLDPGFNQDSIPASVFLTTAIDGAGKVYVTDGARLIRLNNDGTLDTSFARINFNPTFARALAVLPDGILVGGNFTSVFRNSSADATTRNGLAKLDVNGNLTEFNVGANGNVAVLKTLGNGQVLAGGSFTTIGSLARTALAALSTNGSGAVDASFNAQVSSPASILDMAIQGNTAFVAGSFSSVGGVARSALAKVSASTGALDTVWQGRASGAVQKLDIVDDSLYANNENSTSYGSATGALTPRQLARFDLINGTLDASFDPQFTQRRRVLHVRAGDASGRLMVAGNFSAVNAVSRLSISQLNANGTTDTVLPIARIAAAPRMSVACDASQQRIYAQGDFDQVGNLTLPRFVRMQGNAVDSNWRPPVPVSTVGITLSVVPGVGIFNESLTRLRESDGSIDPTWNSAATGSTVVRVVTPNAIYTSLTTTPGTRRFPFALNGAADVAFGGGALRFQTLLSDPSDPNQLYGIEDTGSARVLRRFDALTGALDNAFSITLPASATGSIFAAMDGKGGVWIAGGLSTFNGISVRSPIRIVLATGQLDQNILPTAAGSELTQIMFYHQGNVYGRQLQGASSRVARMPENGGALDASWLLRVRNGSVSSMCVLADRVALSSDSGFDGIGAGISPGFATVPLHDILFRDGLD